MNLDTHNTFSSNQSEVYSICFGKSLDTDNTFCGKQLNAHKIFFGSQSDTDKPSLATNQTPTAPVSASN